MDRSFDTVVLVGILLVVFSVSSLPVLGSIPKGLGTPDNFTQALLNRYGSGDRLTVQDLQVLLWNASRCPGVQQCGRRDEATGAPVEETGRTVEDICRTTCITAREVLQVHNMSGDSELNSTGLREVCPTLLYSVDRTIGCQSQGEDSIESTEESEHDVSRRPSPAEVWGFGVLSVAIISLCSVMGVLVVPFMKKRLYTLLLTFLIALAVGALSGSALFHLIPQAFDLPLEDYTEKAAAVWAGIYLFFITERLLKMASKQRQKRKARKYAKQNGKADFRADAAVCAVRARSLSHVDPPLTELPRHHSHSHGHVFHNPDTEDSSTEDSQSQKKRNCCQALCSNTDTIATVAWMVIFGDGLHNLMDGLAIGASFQVSVFSGISTSLAVLCEEFPHELGDFAILLNAGMSVRQAMFYNFLSACSCFAGLIIGIVVGDNSEVGQWIFGLAGGMFLYISLVDMMPEMNAVDEDEEKNLQDSEGKSSSLLRFFLQNLGLLTGFAVMLVLAKFPFEI